MVLQGGDAARWDGAVCVASGVKLSRLNTDESGWNGLAKSEARRVLVSVAVDRIHGLVEVEVERWIVYEVSVTSFFYLSKKSINTLSEYMFYKIIIVTAVSNYFSCM